MTYKFVAPSIGNAGIEYGVGPPLALMTAPTLAGILAIRCWKVSWGMAAHSSRSAALRRGIHVEKSVKSEDKFFRILSCRSF